MNYFLISNMWPSRQNPGYGSFVKNVVEGLSIEDIQCKYLSVIEGRPATLIDKLLKYIRFYWGILRYYFRKYDFIYIHFPNHALPVLIPLFIIKKKKVIVNLHGEDLLYSNHGISAILGHLNDWFLQRVHAVVVPSSYYQEILKSRFSQCKMDIIISPSGGIDPRYFTRSIKPKAEGRVLYLGFVGRIEANKGWKEYIEMLSKLEEHIIYKATIIGNGSQVADMMDLIKDKGVTNLEYIAAVPQSQLSEYYSNFDLLIFPSSRKQESLGLVGIEAMACATPVIGFSVGGLATYIKNKYNGYLVSVGDVDGLVEAVCRYNKMSILERNQIQLNCIETASRYFSTTVIKDLATSIKAVFDVG